MGASVPATCSARWARVICRVMEAACRGRGRGQSEVSAGEDGTLFHSSHLTTKMKKGAVPSHSRRRILTKINAGVAHRS
jgi:hypothetical protein